MFCLITVMFRQYLSCIIFKYEVFVFLLPPLHQVVEESLYLLLLSDASQRLCLRTGT